MTTGEGEHSESGFLTEAYEGISRTFTDVEVITTSEVNVVAKAKRYGRWWLSMPKDLLTKRRKR